ncbi:acyltransferase family protein [uncultured Sphingomonas sp.]|uniref:acyltransferase family protein n=1 Tax=uncultured Sphingomonas sp. TaxID=158754 RepID=UPI0035CA0669
MGAARQTQLDMVRGTAILLVLLFHFRLPLGSAALDAVLQPVFAVGWIGVDLFFVLSGFLVGRMILVEAASRPAFDTSGFFTRRAWRLWPVLWLYCAILVALGGSPAWPTVWPVLLHVQNYADQTPSHLWSLAVEEHFYLGAALLIPAMYRHGGYRCVERGLLAVMVACLLLRLVAVAAGVPLLHLQWQTQYRLDAPAFGVLLASLSLHRPAAFAALGHARRQWLALTLVGTIALAIGGDGAFRHGIGFTIAYLAAGAFLIATIGCRVPPALSWTGGRLAALGLIAYPVYICHASIGAVARSLISVPSLAFAGAIALSIGVGVMLHILVERPAMRLGRHQSSRQPSLKAIAKQLQ